MLPIYLMSDVRCGVFVHAHVLSFVSFLLSIHFGSHGEDNETLMYRKKELDSNNSNFLDLEKLLWWFITFQAA